MSESRPVAVPLVESKDPVESEVKNEASETSLLYGMIGDTISRLEAKVKAAEQKAEKFEAQLKDSNSKLQAEEVKVTNLITENDELLRQRDTEKRAKDRIIQSNSFKELEMKEMRSEKTAFEKNFNDQMSVVQQLYKQERESRKKLEEKCEKLEEQLRTSNEQLRNSEQRAEKSNNQLKRQLDSKEMDLNEVFQLIKSKMASDVPALLQEQAALENPTAPMSPEHFEPFLPEQQAPRPPPAALPTFEKGWEEDEVRFDMDQYVATPKMANLYAYFNGSQNQILYDPNDTARLPQPVEAVPDIGTIIKLKSSNGNKLSESRTGFKQSSLKNKFVRKTPESFGSWRGESREFGKGTTNG